MKIVKKDLELLKCEFKIQRTFIFGSFVNNRKDYNDIDIILFTDGINKNIEFKKWDSTLPISRIQYNCYKKYEELKNDRNSYDIVVIDNKKTLNNFIKLNADRIIEV